MVILCIKKLDVESITDAGQRLISLSSRILRITGKCFTSLMNSIVLIIKSAMKLLSKVRFEMSLTLSQMATSS